MGVPEQFAVARADNRRWLCNWLASCSEHKETSMEYVLLLALLVSITTPAQETQKDNM